MMVNKEKSTVRTTTNGLASGRARDSLRSPARKVNFVRPPGPRARRAVSRRLSEEAEDVIDLGAPRRPRCAPHAPRRDRPPNPRLYPGPKAKPRSTEGKRIRRGSRKLRPVPNSRLYQPAPPRPSARPPPPARPRAAWPAPAPPRALDTASRVALRLASQPPRGPAAGRAQRLVVTLPEARARRPAPAMEPAGRHSASPEDRSDGNETLSAPSEFLAEFLSAIMRRQYAEALKYCRLILQYEPHNATAQGFYPLLRHKLRAGAGGQEEAERGSSGSSGGEHSDLELDSSPRRSSPSLSLSRRSSRTDDSASGSGGGWDSSGAERSGSAPPDDNGNEPLCPPAPPATLRADDLENDNASAAGEHHHSLKSESAASLRRLRAQFACSIK